MGGSEFSKETRVSVLVRSSRLCEFCGGFTDRGQFHHRKPRGMGGSRDETLSSPANCLYLHGKCHRWIETNREKSYERGFLVRRHLDPTLVAVRLWFGVRFLSPSGAYVSVGEQDD